MTNVFTEAVAKAFEALSGREKVKAEHAGKGATARLRVEHSRSKQASHVPTGPELRRDRREAARRRKAVHRRHTARQTSAATVEAAARRLSESQARVLAGEIGTPAMRRNVYVAVRNQVREEVAKELHPQTRIELEVETDRRLELAGISDARDAAVSA